MQAKVKKPKRHNPFMPRVKVTSALLDLVIDETKLFHVNDSGVHEALLAKRYLQFNGASRQKQLTSRKPFRFLVCRLEPIFFLSQTMGCLHLLNVVKYRPHLMTRGWKKTTSLPPKWKRQMRKTQTRRRRYFISLPPAEGHHEDVQQSRDTLHQVRMDMYTHTHTHTQKIVLLTLT